VPRKSMEFFRITFLFITSAGKWNCFFSVTGSGQLITNSTLKGY
jgi:hypothetical protein